MDSYHTSDSGLGGPLRDELSLSVSNPFAQLVSDGPLAPNAGAMWDFFMQGIVNDIPGLVNPPEHALLPPASPGQNNVVIRPNDNHDVDIDSVALDFARQHRTALTLLFDGIGLTGWVRLCDRLLLKYISRMGLESLRAFKRRDKEEIITWLLLEYEDMLREGYSFEDREIQLSMTVKGLVITKTGRSLINNQPFLDNLVHMITEDMHRVVYAAWLMAAKRIVSIICPDQTNDSLTQARSFSNHATCHGIYTYNFFNDLDASSDAPGKLFTGEQARSAIALALRTVTSLVDEESTLFGIFECVRGEDNILHYCLLRSSSCHTTNVVSSLVLLVLNSKVKSRTIPTLSERKLAELKNIFDENKETFHQVVACSQDDVPMAMQLMFRRNLLDILTVS